MDVWVWIGSIWVMLGIAVVIADKIASPSSDNHGPHSPCRPAESLFYSIALIVGVPFIAAFALAICGKIIWEGKLPLSDRVGSFFSNSVSRASRYLLTTAGSSSMVPRPIKLAPCSAAWVGFPAYQKGGCGVCFGFNSIHKSWKR